MNGQLFPNAHLVLALLIFLVGFLIHWVGQIISLIDWDLSVKLGISDDNTTAEYKTYEKGIATADALIGWTYGLAVVGLLLNQPWAYKLIWVPGVVFVYHGLSFWFWIGHQLKLNNPTATPLMRFSWASLNLITGSLAIWMAWMA